MRVLVLMAVVAVWGPWHQDRVTRLDPSALQSMTSVVRAELARRGCTIPQTWSNPSPHNVISGRFLGRDDVDVAVLCSVKGVSRILVFPGGTTTGVMELSEAPDDGFMQVVSAERGMGYSRAIQAAPVNRISSFLKRAPSIALFSPQHEGIEDVFVEKASTVWYWRGGKWLAIPGMD